MTVSRFRAWRFDFPDPALASGADAGVRLATDGVAMVEDDQAIRQAIFILLSTSVGERVMRPEYGCNLSSLVFSPNDDTTAGLAMHYVRQALQRWEPRVEVIRVDAQRSADDEARLDLAVEYRVRTTQRGDRVTVYLDLERGNR
jgi:hypothetical protein